MVHGMTKAILSDGQKAININDLPPEAWTPLRGGNAGKIEEYHRTVPWLFRGVDLRANAVASLPFAIVNEAGDEVDTSDDYKNTLGFLPNPENLLFLTEASLSLLGRSYLFRERNALKTLGLRFVLASSIEPKFDDKKGLVGFKRRLTNDTLDWDVEDVVYFWLRDPFVELGPPNQDKCPGQAALMAAGVLHNLAEYAAAYFERGAVKPFLVTVPAKPPPSEKKRMESWFNRLFMGVGNAFRPHIFEKDTEFHTVGEGLSELSDSNLTKEQREDIATALGIPMTVLWSTEASGLGGGGVVSSDERKFYEQTVVPEAKFIASALNEQLFSMTGHRLVFRPETLDIFQVDENQRAQSFKLYVDAGLRRGLAAQMLGMELPPGVEYDDLDEQYNEDKEAAAERMPDFGNPQPNPQNPQSQAMRADLKRWERKALNKGADCEFESEHIPSEMRVAIEARLGLATTEEEVKAAFSGPFREAVGGWGWDYP